jgi:3-deoxy-D-manno-octulosonic-acid transferase
MQLLYSIGIWLYQCAMHMAALFGNDKAKKIIAGRKNTLHIVKEFRTANEKAVWMHCASLGEYEQGRPLLEEIKKQFPQKKIVVSFFSSSGAEYAKKDDVVDEIVYMLADTKANAQQFIEALSPSEVYFVKYELWYYHIAELHKKNITSSIISVYLQEKHTVFSTWGIVQKKTLQLFTTIFTQDIATKELLAKHSIHHTTVAGDTRYNRVLQIANTPFEDKKLQGFCKEKKILIAGSSWQTDEQLLADWWKKTKPSKEWKLIIAPHQINSLKKSFYTALFQQCSFYDEEQWDNDVLIVNTIGLLNKIYRFADVVYIGGGFGAGIHNTLEAFAYAVPVLHGPKHQRFLEAKLFLENGCSQVIQNAEELEKSIHFFIEQKENVKQKIEKMMNDNRNAVEVIMKKAMLK